ncbi:hypothetical protein ABBQ38_009318 [Trebouxia sp. C0009 RCD-2024]
MRQQRQASQEVLQRKAAFQRIADRRQNPRRVLDSSSDSDGSDDERGFGDSTSSTRSHFSDGSNFSSAATRSTQGDQKSLQRLSQQKENRHQTHLPVVASAQAPQVSRPAASVTCTSADGEELAGNLAALAITDNPKQNSTAAVLAAAVAVQLPEADPDSNTTNTAAGTAALRAEEAAGLHIAEFRLKPKTANMLYKHQIEGVKWLWSLHKMRRGGILGQ